MPSASNLPPHMSMSDCDQTAPVSGLIPGPIIGHPSRAKPMSSDSPLQGDKHGEWT